MEANIELNDAVGWSFLEISSNHGNLRNHKTFLLTVAIWLSDFDFFTFYPT